VNRSLGIPKKKLSDLASVRELRAFVAVCQHGSLAAAAQVLALSAPAVSVLLRELEGKLGVRLLERTTRSLRITAEGREARAYAERILNQLSDLHTGMEEAASGHRGLVRVAATSSLAQTVIPRVIAAYALTHPQVRVELNDCAPNQFLELILQGQVDLGVGVMEREESDLQVQVLASDRLCVVATPAHALPGQQQISWKQLATLPLVTMRSGYGVRASIDRVAAQASVTLQVAYEVNLMGTALAMAQQGLAVAVLPESMLYFADRSALQVRTLVRPAMLRALGIITRRSAVPSLPAQNFGAALHSHFQALRPTPAKKLSKS
jgi:LysR family carnitine catabolism transcriptional activator